MKNLHDDKKLYSDCVVKFYFDEYQALTLDCIIVIGSGEVELKYDDLDGFVSWKGREVSPGHYIVHANRKGARGTLHRTDVNSIYLEGYWVEGGEKGMWRINLK